MDVLRILDELEEEIEKSSRVPLTGKVIMETEALLEFIDKIRSVLPEEIRQAQWVTKERERIVSDAEREAEKIISEAHEHVDKMADDSKIVEEANRKASETVEEAKKTANEIKQGADEYALGILSDLENTLSKSIDVVRKGQAQLRSSDNSNQEESVSSG